jgi:hypothetical protein
MQSFLDERIQRLEADRAPDGNARGFEIGYVVRIRHRRKVRPQRCATEEATCFIVIAVRAPKSLYTFAPRCKQTEHRDRPM